MHAKLSESKIEEANAQFWEQMLGVEMRLIAQEAADWMEASHVTDWCHLSGVWNGRIEVRMSNGLAWMATSVMLAVPEKSVQESDVVDAVKEIANMIVGTIKSTLPRPCSMTVPEAVMEAREPGEEESVACSAHFQHEAEQLMVRLLERVSST